MANLNIKVAINRYSNKWMKSGTVKKGIFGILFDECFAYDLGDKSFKKFLIFDQNMKLYFKYDRMVACNTLVREQLNKLGLSYELVGPVEVEIKDPVTDDKLKELNTALNQYGIEIVENQKSILVQKIKDTITEVVYSDGELPVAKISAYLADKLKYNYGYLSNLFSDVTYTSIENFTILQKIERAKQLITTDDLTFTEIA